MWFSTRVPNLLGRIKNILKGSLDHLHVRKFYQRLVEGLAFSCIFMFFDRSNNALPKASKYPSFLDCLHRVNVRGLR